MSENTYLDLIFSLMENDTEDREKQSNLMEFYYSKMDEKTKKAVDTIMMSVCGYSIDTIINHPEDIVKEDKGE